MALLMPQDPRVARKMIPVDRESMHGQIEFTERFLEKDFASKEFKEMCDFADVSTDPEVVRRGGRLIEVERRTVLFGKVEEDEEEPKGYHYAGVTKKPKPFATSRFGRAADRVRTKVTSHFGGKFEFKVCFCNYYRDGKVGLGFHSDDETDLDPNAPIVSISLGATRDMVFKHKHGELADIKLPLPSGSMVVMRSPLQSKWKHGIPVRRRVTGKRINLTLRVLRRN